MDRRDTRLPTVKEFLTTTNCTPLSSTKVHRTYHPQLPPKMITMAPVLMCSHWQGEREFTFLTIWTNEFYQKLPAELHHSPLHGDPHFRERIRKKDPPLSLILGVTRAGRLREDLLGLPPAGGRMITVAPTRWLDCLWSFQNVIIPWRTYFRRAMPPTPKECGVPWTPWWCCSQPGRAGTVIFPDHLQGVL